MSESTLAFDPLHDLALIKQEVQKLEAEMSNTLRLFHKTRVNLLWKQNALQASTRNLPPEILVHIFLSAWVPHPCYNRTALKFGGVCSHWRQIVLSTPRLWSSLTLTIHADMVTNEKRQDTIELLQHYLENVKNVPFSLDLQFAKHILPSNLQHIQDLLFSLLTRKEYAQKMHSLRLTRASSAWVSSLPKFPNIADLRIFEPTGCLDKILVLPLVDSPYLRHLVLRDLRSPRPISDNIEHTQFTRISLEGVSIDVSISLLIRCPNLTHFEYINPKPSDLQETDDIHTYGLANDPIILHQLEHFSWAQPDEMDDQGLNRIYSRLRFPVLRTFHWEASPSVHLDDTALQALVPNLPPTLSTLELYFAEHWPIDLIKSVFRHAIHVQGLHIYECDYDTMTNMIIALDTGRRADRGGTYMSKLRDMTMDGIGAHADYDRVAAEAEAKMAQRMMGTLRRRYRDQNTRFSLELSRSCGTWTPDMYSVYSLLREEGIEMKLWENCPNLRFLEKEPEPGEGYNEREVIGSGRGGGWYWNLEEEAPWEG